jgi:MJ0042 family finger-like protein
MEVHMLTMTSSTASTLDVYRNHIDDEKIIVDAGKTLVVEDDQIELIRSIGRESGVEYSVGFMTDSGEFVETSKMSFFDNTTRSENVDQILDRLLPSKSDIDKLIDSSIGSESTDPMTRSTIAFARISLESARSTIIPSEVTIDNEARQLAESLLTDGKIESVNEWNRLVRERTLKIDEIEKQIKDRREEYARQLDDWITEAVERARLEFKLAHPEPTEASDEALRKDLMTVVDELDAKIESMIEKSRSELFSKLIDSGVTSLKPLAKYLSLKNRLIEIVDSVASAPVAYAVPAVPAVPVAATPVAPVIDEQKDQAQIDVFVQNEETDQHDEFDINVESDEESEEDDSFDGSISLDNALEESEDDALPDDQEELTDDSSNKSLYEKMLGEHPNVRESLTGETPKIEPASQEDESNEDESEPEADETEETETEDEPEVEETEAQEAETEKVGEANPLVTELFDGVDIDESSSEPVEQFIVQPVSVTASAQTHSDDSSVDLMADDDESEDDNEPSESIHEELKSFDEIIKSDAPAKKKSRKGLIVGVAAAVLGIGLIGTAATAFWYPGWAVSDKPDTTQSQPASTQIPESAQKTQSNFKSGDRFEIIDNSGNTVPVVIDRFVSEGAIAKDSAGTEWLVPNDMLQKWVDDHPDRFSKSLGPTAPTSAPTSTPTDTQSAASPSAQSTDSKGTVGE